MKIHRFDETGKNREKRVIGARPIKHVLTDHEIELLGREAAELLAEHDEIEQKKKSITAEYAKAMKDLAYKIRRHTGDIRQGYSMRDTKTETVLYFDIKEAVVSRLDTGEVIETRALTDSEAQLEFDY